MLETSALPDDVDALKAMLKAAHDEIARQDQELARRDAELHHHALMIEKLKARLDKQLRDRFGASAEGIDQLQLMLEDLEITRSADAPAADLPEAPKDKSVRKPLPDQLPRREQIIEPGEACSDCGGRLKRVGEDVTEELDYLPGRFVVNRYVRPRMACACCERFHQAPLPSRPIERGRPGPGLLAHVLVSKYADHLPLYRQSQIYVREEIDLSRLTLADWIGQATALLEPLAEAIGAHVRNGYALHADDTPVNVLNPGHGKMQTGRLWAYVRDERPWGSDAPPAAYYRFSVDRKGIRPAKHLKDYTGFLHADGYAGFEEFYRSGGITEVACLAHVRRKFCDIAQATGSPIAAEAVQRTADFYAVEAEARDRPPDVRAAIRQAKARLVFEELVRWLTSQLQTISGKSDLAKAIRYALSRLPRLEEYLSDRRLEIDNNTAERAMRGVVLGRKNRLSAGSEGGDKAAAIALTLIMTGKLNKVDPQDWLTDVLGRIAEHPMKRVGELVPWHSKKSLHRRNQACGTRLFID